MPASARRQALPACMPRTRPDRNRPQATTESTASAPTAPVKISSVSFKSSLYHHMRPIVPPTANR